MEIAPGIHLIPGTVGARPLQLYLLRGESRNVLLDTGAAGDSERFLFPFLQTLGLSPADIHIVISTHADADHVGGNAEFKSASPGTAITCGTLDREWVSSPSRMLAERYGGYAQKHGIMPNAEGSKWLVAMLGDAQPVDWTWSGAKPCGSDPIGSSKFITHPVIRRGTLRFLTRAAAPL